MVSLLQSGKLRCFGELPVSACFSYYTNAQLAIMLLARLRSQPNGTVQLLLRQVTIRHASKTANKGLSKKASKAPGVVKKADRPPVTNTSSNSSNGASSSSIAGEASIAEKYVNEKVIYEMGPNEKVADARLLLGFGLMFCIFVSFTSF